MPGAPCLPRGMKQVQRYILARILQGIATVFAVVTFVFFLLRMAPGDPAYNLVGQYATQEQLAQVRAMWGLDKPVLTQYFTYLANVLHGNFGESFVWQQPALSVVAARLPYTFLLAFAGIAVAAAIAIPLGIMTGLRRGSALDTTVNLVTIAGQSMPEFWVGVMLVFFFAVKLHLVPTSGYQSYSSIILPAVTVAILQIALVSRILRGELSKVMASQYITVARAQGLSERAVVWGRAMKNAAIPVITVLGIRFAGMLNGVVVIEAVFSWPGIGSTALAALGKRDYPLIQAIVVVTAALTVGLNLLIDLMYTALDPRVRLERGTSR
jgi:peptide/nickel transport system permease protein